MPALIPATARPCSRSSNEKVLVIGENIKVRRFARYDTGLNVPYVHMGGRIAVLVNLETESTDAARSSSWARTLPCRSRL